MAPLPSAALPGWGLGRRHWMAAMAGSALGVPAGGAWALAPRTLAFPRDHGSHPGLRTEWWYITGHARAAGRLWGFQVTFFRSRVDATQGLQSQFAARQLLFAHAALSDVQGQRLQHDQRIARAGFGIAEASEIDTAVHLRDWHLVRTPTDAPGHSRYRAQVAGDGFALDLTFDSTQPVLLQGSEGLSRKGPEAAQASYYYSQPQLAVRGTLTQGGRRMALEPGGAHDNRAWLDHECSEALLHPEAVGWDWIGMNLQDGRALTAFHLRRADGSQLWAGGSVRAAGAVAAQVFAHDAVAFTPVRHWSSALSGARYPVEWKVETPAGTFSVHALLDDQELDSRGSTGAIYWEGLCELRDAAGRAVGRGYLEMTGYAQRLQLG
ncbi:lipocalin-like domain-containing protein [Pulveribacter suum]|uniref:Carotenoid 1,2-hydratase n=1 Tax=Pulveribacter suum TaxID=2116657 RepID=A0A2P1NMY8_9BURK|nr:carotenoid 1,2-hydratase [Pulveribacter suum]